MRILLLAVAVGWAPFVSFAAPSWKPLADGVDYASFPILPKPETSDGKLHVVRLNSSKVELRSMAVSQVGGPLRTAKQWLNEFQFIAVINAGMYETDFSTHSGYFQLGDHLNSTAWRKNYQSLLAFQPKREGLPSWDLMDVEQQKLDQTSASYETVVQNLRLLKNDGSNVWKENGRRWSEAAVAQDEQGHLYFLFARSPLSMYAFAETLRSLPLRLVKAFHVEGGPEASLSLKGEGLELHLSGSYETGFNENDANARQWPLPNVLGVVRKTPKP